MGLPLARLYSQLKAPIRLLFNLLLKTIALRTEMLFVGRNPTMESLIGPAFAGAAAAAYPAKLILTPNQINKTLSFSFSLPPLLV